MAETPVRDADQGTREVRSWAGRSFSLLYEPWIPVVFLDGRHSEVGIVEAVERAHELRMVQGDAPVVTSALYRLLLAFLHRVYGPADIDEWHRMWRAEGFDPTALRTYADVFSDRFDLFALSHPFFQSPELSSIEPGPITKLLMYRSVGNNATLFDHTVATDRLEISAAEAARWLVTVQMYDTGGLKTPFAGNGKSSVAAPGGRFAVVLATGADLKDTLLLNMPTYPGPHTVVAGMSGNADRPIWERDQPPGGAPEDTRNAAGWTERLTWPSRRILLRSVEGNETVRVDGVVVTPGSRLDEDLTDGEAMAAFRGAASAASRGGDRAPAPTPVRLEELRGVWRYAVELLLPLDEQQGYREGRKRPRTLDFIGQMVDLGYLPADSTVSLRVFGQRLAANPGAVEAWLEESVPVRLALLRADTVRWGLDRLLGAAVKLADDVGDALSDAEKFYLKAQQADYEKEKSLLRQWFWPLLPPPFQLLLDHVGGLAADWGRDGPRSENDHEALTRRFLDWGAAVCGNAEAAAARWADDLVRRDARQLLVLGEQAATLRSKIDKLHADYIATIINR